MSWAGLNQQPLSGYANYYHRPQGCCAGCCRCQCHSHQYYITYTPTPPMTPPGIGSQPWAYQSSGTAQVRGDNVVDFTSNWEAHPDAQPEHTID
jgi:hypothetical protein